MQWQNWIGKAETVEELISHAHILRMAALFNHPALQMGENLPPLWHWAFFNSHAAQSEIGPDGHPKRGGFLPPVPLPRRMWAGGRLRFHAPIVIGDIVQRQSRILDITEKQGRQGKLVFLTLRHSLHGPAGLLLEEEQDIVYREASTTRLPEAVETLPLADWRESFTPDSVLLFRYSAVTFNGHRIHYDLPYAMNQEHYPGLVVHGPLTATKLLASYVYHVGSLPRQFSFRGQSPLFVDKPVQICGRRTESGHELWAEGRGGYQAMVATVSD